MTYMMYALAAFAYTFFFILTVILLTILAGIAGDLARRFYGRCDTKD